MGVINAFPSGAPVQEYKNKVEITTSQEWTVPERVTEIRVTCIGGGAAGRGYSAGYAGGGGGYFAQKVLQVVPGTKYAITIGAGEVYSSNSSSAGKTSFGDLVSANGGNGSSGGTGGGGSHTGGSGDSASGGWSRTRSAGTGQVGYGADGGMGGYYSASNGGSTLTAFGGKGTYTTSWNGSGYDYGAGGGGGAGINGGNGGDGCRSGDDGYGGGGGGYGTTKLATDGKYTSYSTEYTGAKGGLGYGAGGGGGATPGNGAPGICIIEY